MHEFLYWGADDDWMPRDPEPESLCPFCDATDTEPHAEDCHLRIDAMARHAADGCDERCPSCPACYAATGDTVCGLTCKHFELSED